MTTATRWTRWAGAAASVLVVFCSTAPAGAQDGALNGALNGPGAVSEWIEAARRGDAETLRVWLAAGADASRADVDGTTALHWAARRGDVEIVEMLLAAGADPEAGTRYAITPLSLAASMGHAGVVRRLLDAGVEANAVSRKDQTALMSASLNGSVEAIDVLLSHGARVDATEPVAGQTALMWAAGEGNAAAVDRLIGAGADPEARSEEGFTALLLAVLYNRIDAARVLLDHGADVEATAPDGTSALNMAVVNAYYDMASVLLDHGADPNAPDPRGSALHTLAWLRKPGATGTAAVGGAAHGPPVPTGMVTALELAAKLLDHGADPNIRVDFRERPFDKQGAAVTNPPGIDLGRHILTYVGATPFYLAANNGDAPLMRVLLEGGADPTIPNRFGVTPLMVAAGLNYYEGESPGPFTGTSEEERLEAVKLALESGNVVNARADFGDYPILGDPAYTLIYYPVNIDDLADLGVGDPRWDGSTALHGSILSGQLSIVQYLIDNGADIEAKNDSGWTPLMMARGVFLANAEKVFPEAEELLTRLLEDGDRNGGR